MKKFKSLLVVILLISCAGRNTDIASNPYLIGKWTGEARFLDRDFKKEIGKNKIEIELKEDNTILSRIGDAQIIKTSIAKTTGDFEIKGELDSKLIDDFSFKKRKIT